MLLLPLPLSLSPSQPPHLQPRPSPRSQTRNWWGSLKFNDQASNVREPASQGQQRRTTRERGITVACLRSYDWWRSKGGGGGIRRGVSQQWPRRRRHCLWTMIQDEEVETGAPLLLLASLCIWRGREGNGILCSSIIYISSAFIRFVVCSSRMLSRPSWSTRRAGVDEESPPPPPAFSRAVVGFFLHPPPSVLTAQAGPAAASDSNLSSLQHINITKINGLLWNDLLLLLPCFGDFLPCH